MMALHLHDVDGSCIHRLPFDGTLDWTVIMKNIQKSGYTGATTIEAMNWDYQDIIADAFLHKAFERATRLERLK